MTELRPCGTETAYQRHRSRGEPIDDACRKAHNATVTEWNRAHRAAVLELIRRHREEYLRIKAELWLEKTRRT